MSVFDVTLTKKEIICDDVVLLDFATADEVAIPFVAGQYANIFIEIEGKSGGHQGRSYSMIPTTTGVRLAVRKRGEFSTALSTLALGTKVVVDGPQGTLCPRQTQHSFVCIAGGIGIAPFVSWLEDFQVRSKAGEEIRAQFFLSNSFKRRAPYLDHFTAAQKNTANIFCSLFFTKEQPAELQEEGSLYRRITAADIEKAVQVMPEADFAVCGSISFTRDMWKALKQAGVPEERILTEAFF